MPSQGYNKKILYVTRLHKGLINSIKNKKWQPSGVPAVYKLLEALAAKDFDITLVLICNDREEGEHFQESQQFRLQSPNIHVHVLPYNITYHLPGRRIRRLTHLIRNILYCFTLFQKKRFAICYFTKSNPEIAAFLACFTSACVVLRFLGITDDIRRIIKSPLNIRDRLYQLLFRAPFSLVICSQDGSGGEFYLREVLRPKIPLWVPINGVGPFEKIGSTNHDTDATLKICRDQFIGKKIILFVGRLEQKKGGREFIEAMIALTKDRGDFVAFIIGTGSLLNELESQIQRARVNNSVKLIGALPHRDIPNWLDWAHIYVSMNLEGNISNTNLEAMLAGKCLVCPEPDTERHIDEFTSTWLPEGTYFTVDRQRLASSLEEILRHILDHPELIKSTGMKLKQFAKNNTQTWTERIDAETELLQSFIQGNTLQINQTKQGNSFFEGNHA